MKNHEYLFVLHSFLKHDFVSNSIVIRKLEMVGTINKVILVGILVKDPEVRMLQSGDKTVNLLLMTHEAWENRATNQTTEKTEYYKVVVFSKKLIAQIEKEVSKGDQLYIEGQLRVRKWQDKQGFDHYRAEIVLFSHNGVLFVLNQEKRAFLSPVDSDVPYEIPA